MLKKAIYAVPALILMMYAASVFAMMGGGMGGGMSGGSFGHMGDQRHQEHRYDQNHMGYQYRNNNAPYRGGRRDDANRYDNSSRSESPNGTMTDQMKAGPDMGDESMGHSAMDHAAGQETADDFFEE